MKKLSMLLALLLVATCCMLASCGGEDDTSSTASVASSATSSVEASSEAESSVEEVSSEAESSVEEESSEPEESSEEEFVKNPDALSTEGENVALGKTYVVSEQYRQNNTTWQYDETCDIVYPDNGVELTDGIIPEASEGYGADGWAGFNPNTPAQSARGYAFVTIDLTEVYAFTAVDATFYAQSDVGIYFPESFTVLVSEDGENFTEVGVATISAEGDGVLTATAECDATGRYVQVRFNSGDWDFIGEIAVK